MQNFRFIDRIIDLEPGVSIHAQRSWPGTLPFFDDHFPEFPVVPGVLLTEMMGQAGALCIESKHPEYGKALLMKIKDAVFRSWVFPDQTIDIYASISSVTKDFSRMKTTAEVEGKKVSSAEIISVWEEWKTVGMSPDNKLVQEFLATQRGTED